MTPSRFCENCGAALDPGQRFCAGCGQPADGSAAAPQPMMSTPTAMADSAKPGWHMPGWAWLLVGLLVAGGIGGGLFYVFNSVSPKQPVYTKAQQDSIAQHVTDDLPNNPDGIDLNKATNPTDLPPDLQKKFDNSQLSDEHNRQIAEALGPLPKIDGELVNTKGKPSFSDDFSNPSSGWTVGEDAKAVREYADGKLVITFNGERGSAQSFQPKKAGNFAAQIEVTPVSGPPKVWYGVTLRQSSKDKFVVFVINPQGYYAVSKREGGKNTSIAEPFKSPVIKTGTATNIIRVSVVDEYFVFDVNGQTVEVQSIPGFEPGVVGVMVIRSPNDTPEPSKVAFDNFKLWAVR
jgi:hypothetical protein